MRFYCGNLRSVPKTKVMVVDHAALLVVNGRWDDSGRMVADHEASLVVDGGWQEYLNPQE